MQAKLQVLPEKGEPFEVEIGNTATIGRTHDNTVCLRFSPRVSRQHAIIRCHNADQYQVIDLGSLNGTYVNDKRVIMPVVLQSGDRVTIADNELVFIQPDALPCSSETLEATIAGTRATSAPSIAEVALLVCDIRGFSAAAEIIPGSELAQLLGAWFRDAGNIINDNQGVIDKFIGDGLLAYWTKQNDPSECELALRATKSLLTLAGITTWVGAPQNFRIVISLHYGRVTCGNIGLVPQRDATVIGDTVNTVFRLEILTKEMGRTVIASEGFVSRLTESTAFDDLGEYTLRGKLKPVRVFGLHQPGEATSSP